MEKESLMYKNAVIIGKFMPLHKGHIHMVEFAKGVCENLTILVDCLDGQSLSTQQRVDVIKKTFPDSHIKVKGLKKEMPQSPDDHVDFWNIWRSEIVKNTPKDLDVIIGAMDYIKDLSRVLSINFLMIDKQRSFMPISATEIRKDPISNWKYLAPHSRSLFTKKITIVGGESTGKTTLAKNLADFYETIWVPEYARTAIEEDEGCSLETFNKILIGQESLMESMTQHAENGLIFNDTDLLATKIWFKKMFPNDYLKESKNMKELILKTKSDLYILTNNKVDWKSDEVRFYPKKEDRDWFEKEFEDILMKNNFPYLKLKTHSLSDRVLEVDNYLKGLKNGK
jgi:HTH-type transcriptional repressor of NAD biosynthesis genes